MIIVGNYVSLSGHEEKRVRKLAETFSNSTIGSVGLKFKWSAYVSCCAGTSIRYVDHGIYITYVEISRGLTYTKAKNLVIRKAREFQEMYEKANPDRTVVCDYVLK